MKRGNLRFIHISSDDINEPNNTIKKKIEKIKKPIKIIKEAPIENILSFNSVASLKDLPPLKNTKMKYNPFLRTQYWKVVKGVINIRDGHKCTKCGSKSKLNVHHLSYGNHFYEHLHTEDLITLCNSCHKQIHGK